MASCDNRGENEGFVCVSNKEESHGMLSSQEGNAGAEEVNRLTVKREREEERRSKHDNLHRRQNLRERESRSIPVTTFESE